MTLRYLLDTNIVSEPLRPLPHVNVMKRLEQYQGEVAIASVVWHELWYGCRRLPPSKKRDAIELYLETVIAATVPILAYDEAAATWHAAERARLGRAGQTPPFSDGQIAAVAAANNLSLATLNLADYQGFGGLRVEDWSAEPG